MAKKVSTKKREESEDIPSVLEHFNIEETEEPTKPEPKKEVDIDALVTRLDRLENDNRTLQQSNLALMSTPVAPIPAPTIPVLQTPSDLPDPVTEPELYASAIERRVEEKITARNAEASEAKKREDDANSRVSALWDQFAADGKYDDYAEFPDRVSFAAEKVATRAGRKGLDLNRYMYVTTDQFFIDVASEMDKIFPKVAPVAKTSDEDDKDDDDAERTGGIFGGLETGSKLSDDKKDEKGDMITDLIALQRKSEFF